MTELSLIQLVREASLVVQLVMLLLLLISIYSWTLIVHKGFFFKKTRWAAADFESRFWKGKDLNALYNSLVQTTRQNNQNQSLYIKKPSLLNKLKPKQEDEPTGMANIFITGYMEFVKLRKQANMTPNALLEGTRRSMRVVLQREMDKLDTHLAVLATVGSVSPYIGLFGTVWGIMNSFQALGNVQQATLAMVAPGISEALIATAMGLFAAIPAVMAYNYYVDNVDRLTTRYETFLDEFTGILQRQAHAAI
jgi:biopolymer transport protein TolQ